MNEDESITRGAMKDYKAHFSELAWPLTIFMMITVVSLVVFALLGMGMVVLMLLLVVPFFFGLQVCCSSIKNGGHPSGSFMLSASLAYFRPPYTGVYRALISCLKTLLVYFFATILTYGIYYACTPAFRDTLNELTTLLSSSSVTNEQINAILNGDEMNRFLVIDYIVTYGTCAFSLIYLMSFNSLSFYTRTRVASPSARVSNYIFSRSLNGNRGYVYKNHFLLAWPMLLGFAIGYIGGAILGYLYLNNLAVVLAIAYGAGFLLMLFAIPYFFFGMERTFKGMEKKVMTTVTDILEQSIRDMEQSAAFTDEQIKDARQTMEDLKKEQGLNEDSQEQDKEDKKDGDDDDFIHHDPSEYV